MGLTHYLQEASTQKSQGETIYNYQKATTYIQGDYAL